MNLVNLSRISALLIGILSVIQIFTGSTILVFLIGICCFSAGLLHFLEIIFSFKNYGYALDIFNRPYAKDVTWSANKFAVVRLIFCDFFMMTIGFQMMYTSFHEFLKLFHS